MSVRPILLLDVMDTVVHDPFFDEVLRFLDLDLEQFLRVKNKDIWIEFEHGRIDEADYLRQFFRDGREFDSEGLKRCLRTSYRWLDGMEPLLVELRSAGVTMHALSNYPVWWQIIEEELELSRYLDWTFVSCRTGVRKPAPEAYLGAARALGVEPDQCLFVDDREHNCSAAVAVGMRARHFTNARSLRQHLVGAGLL